MMKILYKVKKIPNYAAIMFITYYRACISPIFPGCCRFRPTCSEYALESFKKFGFKKGFILSIKRLSKCHPFGGKGYDPVPEFYKKYSKNRNYKYCTK